MFPDNFKPMPLKRHYKPFSHHDWFFALKHDGFRALIIEQTGITLEEVEAVHVAWFRRTTEQLFRELQLADVLELALAKLRSGQGWGEVTTGDVLREILHVYPEQSKKLSGNGFE